MLLQTDDLDLDRVLFDEAPIGLAFLDRDLRYIRVNRALAEINGMPVDAHLGRSAAELWPDLDPRVFAALHQVTETGMPVERLEVEASTPAMPGVVRTFVQAYRPVKDAAGEIVGVNCSVVEVTDLRAAETAAHRARAAADLLASANGRLAAATSLGEAATCAVEAVGPAFGAMTAGLFLLDPDGQTLRAVASHGYAQEIAEQFGEVPADAPTPAAEAMRDGTVRAWRDIEEVQRSFPAIAGAMREMTGERAIANAPLLVDGRAIGALHVGFAEPRVLSDDELRQLRAVADVAAQAIARIRHVEDERRWRRLLEASLDQMPLGVVVADPSGRILLANAESGRIWGRVPTSMGDSETYKGFHPDGRPFEPEDWQLVRSLRTGEVIHAESAEIVTFDGRRRVIEDSSAPIRDDAGTIIGGVVVFADVTERRSATEARDAFMGILSHELRTPITSIYGAATLLNRARSLDEPVRQGLIEDIEAEANRLARLVENLLVLARAERDATVIDAAPLMLQRLVAAIIDAEERTWPSLRVSIVAPPVLPPVSADEALVGQIIRNLVGNAAKYAPGPVEVTMEQVGTEILVRVQDHGQGIPAAERQQIFDLFRRGERAGGVPGAGIGLFVVRHLAESMGGRAWAEAGTDGGAVFGFALPVEEDLDLT